MLAVQGYYDGAAIRLLEKITAKPNQKVIVTIMDEFVEQDDTLSQMERERLVDAMAGCLSQYAKKEHEHRRDYGNGRRSLAESGGGEIWQR